jgi:hypothetical protein
VATFGPSSVAINPVNNQFPNGQAMEIFNPLKSLYDGGTAVSSAAPGSPAQGLQPAGWSLRNLYVPVIGIVVILWALEHRRLSVSGRLGGNLGAGL